MPKTHFDAPKGTQQILLNHLEAVFRRIRFEGDEMEPKLVPKCAQNRVKIMLEIENVFWTVLGRELYTGPAIRKKKNSKKEKGISAKVS